MTAPTTTHSDFYRFLARLHGHRCPMSILGARLGMGALPYVGRHGDDGDVRATYYNRNCALDGIQAVLGTTMGNQNLDYVPEGRFELYAENVMHGKSLRVTLTPKALEMGKAYGELRRRGATLEEKEALLRELETASDEVLISVEIIT